MPTNPYPAIGIADPAALAPFGRRVRTHSAEQIAAIALAIRHFRFNGPVLLEENGLVLIGWGRVLAARLIGLDAIPVLPVMHLSNDQKRAYIIADNQLALLAEWDADLLRIELEELAAAGFDLTLTGFSDDDLNAILLPSQSDGDPDAAPPLPEIPVSRPGDVWILGRHRLLCGDATDRLEVARLLDGAIPHLMVTDPPYGVNYDPAWRQKAGLNDAGAATGKVANDHCADWRKAWALFPGHVAYVWHSGNHCATVQGSLEARGMRLRAQIVWVKSRPVISRGHYHFQHEPALYMVEDGKPDGLSFEEDHAALSYAVANGETARWSGDRRQSSVWFIDHVKNDTGHGTQKPVECMRRPMLNNAKAGDLVYDPFMGSGTSIIAAEMSGRRCYGLELTPGYVDVAVKRWQTFADAPARLANGGATFDEVTLDRAKS